MEVLLRRDVESLGKMGEVVDVTEGYARNFLLPHRLALAVTDENKRRLEGERRQLEARQAEEKKERSALAEKLKDKSCTIPVKVGENKQLFGSVTVPMIVDALKEEGLELEPRMVGLEHPIKDLGIYEVPLRLDAELTATLKVWVVEE